MKQARDRNHPNHSVGSDVSDWWSKARSNEAESTSRPHGGGCALFAGAQGDDSRRKVWLSLGVNDDPLTLHEKIPSQRLGQIVDKVSDLQTLKSLQDKEARLQMKAHT